MKYEKSDLIEIGNTLAAVRMLLGDPEVWIKGEYSIGDKVCLAGAAHRVCNDVSSCRFSESSVRTIVFMEELAGVPSIEDWNDAPERTHSEVLAFIDACILDVANRLAIMDASGNQTE